MSFPPFFFYITNTKGYVLKSRTVHTFKPLVFQQIFRINLYVCMYVCMYIYISFLKNRVHISKVCHGKFPLFKKKKKKSNNFSARRHAFKKFVLKLILFGKA